jgi:CRP/FNR family transcriptional regulator, anaerobic regulatory protein
MFECGTCPAGALAIYARTLQSDSNVITHMRRSVVTLEARVVIQDAGQVPGLVYTLRRGWACRMMRLPNGRRQILSILLPGDTLAMEAICLGDYALTYALQALTDVTLCGFKPAEVHDLMFSSELQQAPYARYVMGQKASAERRLADIGRRHAIGALANLVLDLEARLRRRGLARGDAWEFPLRQTDLADALGLTNAHVNRTLFALKQEGVLQIGNGKLRLLDRARLIALSRA